MRLENTQKCSIKNIIKLREICTARANALAVILERTIELYDDTKLKLHKERYSFYNDTRQLNIDLVNLANRMIK